MRNPPMAPKSAAVFALGLLLLIPQPAQAYEVDNFTERDTLTQDAMPVLDAKVNQLLRRAVEAANKESPDRCNRVLLRQEIVRWTGPDPVSFMEFWASFTGDIQHTHAGLDESIYAGATLTESPGMWSVGIGRSFRLSGHVVGTDKLGHFFMQGLDYFKRVEIDRVPLDHVMRFEHGEDGVWGLKMTGVKSYADMAANYAGYRFWSQLYNGEKPYARCENGRKWVKARDFTWADYVTDAWDEAINCSEMKPELQARVDRNLAKRGMRCPVEPGRCLELGQLEKSEYYLSPACRQVIAAKLR